MQLFSPGKVLLLLSMAVMSTACVTSSQRITGNSNAHAVSELRDWQARGRVGVSTEVQSGSGGFSWQQTAGVSEIQIHGPVGVGALSLLLDESGVKLLGSDGTYLNADAALLEMQSDLGASLPITLLRYWMLGVEAPGEYHWLSPARNLLEQAGWQISYEEWVRRGELRLPARIQLVNGTTRILLVVQSWNLSA